MFKKRLPILPPIYLSLVLILSACIQSGAESYYLKDKYTLVPSELPNLPPGLKPSVESEIGIREPCSFKIPKALKLPAIEAFSSEDVDESHIQIDLPRNLCVPAYPPELKGYFIVLFTDPIIEEYKEQVISKGGIIYSYIPENGFIVKMSDKTRNEIEDLRIVKWVGIYQPAYKITPAVEWTDGDPPAREVSLPLLTRTGDIILNVGVFYGEDLADILSKIESLGGKVSGTNETSPQDIRVLIDGTKIPEIANITGVVHISEYRIPEIND